MAQNVIYLKSMLSKLESVRVGIPDLEDKINKTRGAMEEAEFDLNAAFSKGELSGNGGFSCSLEEGSKEPPGSWSWPFNPLGWIPWSAVPRWGPLRAWS